MRFVLPLFMTFILSALPTYAASTPVSSEGHEAIQPLTKEDAIKALQGLSGEVVSVTPAEVPGLFRVAMKMHGKVIPIYLDASGSYLFSGNIIRIKDRKNLTKAYFQRLNPVDTSTIPLEDALILGNPKASQRVFVFTDPHCPYCSKLHNVLHEAIKANPDIVFYIKLLPLKQSSKKIAQTILCNKSMKQLEMAFSGQALPDPSCDKSDVIAKNLALAHKLGISGTPAVILPNGQISLGYRPLKYLLKLITENSATPK